MRGLSLRRVPDPPVGSVAVPEITSDRDLLARFASGDEPAFTELVERHAPLVMGVCRRILRQANDAEDAFQATFLVLAAKARSLAWQDSIAGWLHQTARRTSLKLRGMTARRRTVESQAAQAAKSTSAAPSASVVPLNELAEILDEELSKLPSKFRDVFLLSQVEGLGREETAERLGISAAAVKDRLERGREQLRLRLVRRGITVSATMLAAWLVPGSVQAGQVALVAATTHAATTFTTGAVAAGSVPTAVTLAQGVLKMMGLEKLKVLALGLMSMLTVGTIAYGMLRDEPQRFEKGLRGNVVAVNLTGKTPTVTVNLDGDVLLNLDIDPQAKVWTAFEAGQLADLQTDRLVSLRLGDDHRTVREIHVLGQQREVTIRAIEPSGKILVTDAEADDEEEAPETPQPVQLAPDAIVRINGLPATRDDLKPGMRVPLEFSPDGKKVNAIETEGDSELVLSGEILEVQANDKQLKLRVWDEEAGDEGRTVTLNVLSDTLILLDDKPAPLNALPLHGDVILRLHEGKTSIRALKAATLPVEPADDDAEMNAEEDEPQENEESTEAA